MHDKLTFPPLSELTQRLTTGVTERGNLAEMLLHITREAQDVFLPDLCLLTAYHPITGDFHYARILYREDPSSSAQPQPQTPLPNQNPLHASLAQKLDETQMGLLCIPDLNTTPTYQSESLHREKVQALGAIALQKGAGRPHFGVLLLAFRQSRNFSSEEQEVLRQFALMASFILQETWLLQRYREITHIGQIINQEVTSVETLLQTLHPLIQNVLDTRHALMLAIHQAPTHTRDLYGIDEGNYIREDNRAPAGASRYVLQERTSVLIQHWQEEKQNHPFRIAHVQGTAPKQSFIYVPLLMGDIPIGIFSIQHPQPHAYTQEDVAILEILANHITLAINNIRLYDSLLQLNEIGRLLTSQIELQYPLQATLKKILSATGAETVLLYPTLASHTVYDTAPLQPLIEGVPLLSHLSNESFWSWQDSVTEKMASQQQTLFEPECASTRERLLHDIRPILTQEGIKSLAIMPLHVEQEAVGVLSLFFQQTQYFDTPQKLLIEGLAHFAAIAIRNAQTFNGLLQRRIHELEILQRIDKELNSSLSLEAILASLLRNACAFVPAEGAIILLQDSKKQTLETRAAYGPNAEYYLRFKTPISEVRGLTGWVLHYKQPVCVNNVHRDSPWNRFYVGVAPNTTSELAIPLLDGGQAIGVLNFESSREGAFRQEDQDFLQTLAGQAVLAITKAQAYEREKRLAGERQVLYDISKELTSQLDPQKVFELILEKALELMKEKSRTGCLMRYDRERQRLWMAAERGVLPDKKGSGHSVNEGIVGQVARTKQLLNVDPSQPGWKDIYLSYIRDTRSELAVPMVANGELKGYSISKVRRKRPLMRVMSVSCAAWQIWQ
ncbi:GAF domain-containing protein [Ktedonospora formicarum]|uniref:GAF domain-containing protein n=1 Tax=Ktedonospora formicarum TaxID=2778364 RepID=A0A8J3I5B4_9CHLR|nr:GAF domain-containing protein [Ktedonospora formicarum]GHO45069.1 hypothetical protein KSX_32320 [Ktedonospora formicarum]